MKLRKWQQEAWNEWTRNGHKGTIQASTGSGKSFLGLKAIQEHKGSIIIVVPTQHLQQQWKTLIQKHCNTTPTLLGGQNTDGNPRIVVAIINSLWDTTADVGLLILDEAHRYASKKSRNFLSTTVYDRLLCLTATLKRQDGQDTYIKQRAPIIYEQTVKESIEQGIISPYTVHNHYVRMSKKEQEQYDQIDTKFRKAFGKFDNSWKKINTSKGWDKVNAFKYMSKRKSLILNSRAKTRKAKELLKKHEGDAVIFFSELKKVTTKLYHEYQGNKVLYHSGLGQEEREQALAQYKKYLKQGSGAVLFSVKALDEGLDVPESNVAIIHSSTSTKRQFIQRVGRTLRKTSNPEKVSQIHQIILKNTQDTKWNQKRMKTVPDNIKVKNHKDIKQTVLAGLSEAETGLRPPDDTAPLLFLDGACTNPAGGVMTGACILQNPNHTQIFSESFRLEGLGSQNDAEYKTLIRSLQSCKEKGFLQLKVFMDSQLVVNQVNKKWKTKNLRMKKHNHTVQELIKQFLGISFVHVRRTNPHIKKCDVLNKKPLLEE